MATICYHDIGDYLSREEKLKRIRNSRSVSGVEWSIVIPNEKHDWINQRDGVFDSMFLLGDKDDKTNKRTFFLPYYGRGLATSRDAWCYNSSKESLINNIKTSIDFYNAELMRFEGQEPTNRKSPRDFVNYDSTRFSWDRAQLDNDIPKGRAYSFDSQSLYQSLYRPFFRQHCYMNRQLNNCVYQMPQIFPTPSSSNIVICVKGVGDRDFSCLISNCLADLQLNFNGQCFPLYWYEENKNKQKSLFYEASNDDYIRRDGITDWILKEVRTRYGTKTITKEMIFYYVYGLLHSKDYRERFAADLKKSLPRIPIVDSLDDFMDFYKAGKRLADLHLNYETVAPCPDVVVHGDRQVPMTVKQDPVTGGFIEVPRDEHAYNYFRVVDKMRFRSKDDKSVIIYNGNITIENIPKKAYEYIVNGKSAIEWIVERYAVTQDKKSLIKNDANDWALEHHKPRYILDLLLSVINVSVQTVDIVNDLPRLKFE